MILNLNNLLGQLQRMLSDPDALIWPADQLTDLIRVGLEELQTLSQLKLAVEGLDGAVSTLLEKGMYGYLLRSTLCRAVETRLLNRMETFHPDSLPGSFSPAWLEQEKTELRCQFESLRLISLQGSADAPYALWEEEENPPFLLTQGQGGQ
jgi:hypothetical protein